jgi:4a-hydroxytetrahydrobiopterin dehydratase
MAYEKLSDDAIQQHLSKLNGWTREGDEISKTYELPSFPAALAFVSTVGHLAEAANHHPDILVKYKNVTLSLTSHDAGGLTAHDFDLAEQVDGLPMKSG